MGALSLPLSPQFSSWNDHSFALLEEISVYDVNECNGEHEKIVSSKNLNHAACKGQDRLVGRGCCSDDDNNMTREAKSSMAV